MSQAVWRRRVSVSKFPSRLHVADKLTRFEDSDGRTHGFDCCSIRKDIVGV
jgi:hypothetical protein